MKGGSCVPGDSEADQAARARLQGADLLQSDMAAFKAANPACQLADFVRWHSPKDWHPDPSQPQGGRVSDRMSHQVSNCMPATHCSSFSFLKLGICLAKEANIFLVKGAPKQAVMLTSK